ncbi:hypothetical protein KFL_002250130 [Klebsormidium nitens]|uniref:Uncharacterized protein n=1 Tax=Klebsormidium nitens TaxID=105231 RepID=A0A1Y1I421_KLENI|nr:hypothetical protein KFL_002250130 [Klebsormidium nitens]|eukprot:GAQ85233.1 hypothetical protein KFL_002250130 [Klebsormidium nitens]
MALKDSTFAVHGVPPAQAPYPKADLQDAFAPFCNDPKAPLKMLKVDETARNLVQTHDIKKLGMSNGLAAACVSAWNCHYNLELSPDGLAAHVNANAEKLRSIFVNHEGKKDILLHYPRYGDLDKHLGGEASFNWQDVIRDFASAVGERTKSNVGIVMECDFSTTGLVELTVSQLALMDAMQPYFNYCTECICGIPKITLTGTVEDWKKIRAKAAALAAYDLDWWLQELLPVLDHFVPAREGRPDVTFWQRICRQDGGTVTGMAYNKIPEFVSGWLSVFFPYDSQNRKRDLRWDAPKPMPWPPRSKVVPHDPEASKDQSAEYGLRIYNTDFPSGVSSAPINVKLRRGESLQLKLLGGFVGVEQDPVMLTLKPAISWCAAQCLPPAPQAEVSPWS